RPPVSRRPATRAATQRFTKESVERDLTKLTPGRFLPPSAGIPRCHRERRVLRPPAFGTRLRVTGFGFCAFFAAAAAVRLRGGPLRDVRLSRFAARVAPPV